MIGAIGHTKTRKLESYIVFVYAYPQESPMCSVCLSITTSKIDTIRITVSLVWGNVIQHLYTFSNAQKLQQFDPSTISSVSSPHTTCLQVYK